MKLIISRILFILLITGCRSSHEERKSDTHTPDTTAQSTQAKIPPPTSIAPNVSGIEAVVEKIDYLDAVQFNVGIFIISSTPVGGRTSVVETGQRLVVSPQFVKDPLGNVDTTIEINRRLMSIKSKETGQSFKGKISLNRYGGWNLVDVEPQE